jgi:periplasmic divalent cation tolerance protein
MIQFVVTTLPDETSAAAIVHELVEKKFAACGTLLPAARSIYRWKDSIEDTSEVVVIFKIPATHFSIFSSALQSLHPYENPEIVAFDPAEASAIYSTWILDSCK